MCQEKDNKDELDTANKAKRTEAPEVEIVFDETHLSEDELADISFEESFIDLESGEVRQEVREVSAVHGSDMSESQEDEGTDRPTVIPPPSTIQNALETMIEADPDITMSVGGFEEDDTKPYPPEFKLLREFMKSELYKIYEIAQSNKSQREDAYKEGKSLFTQYFQQFVDMRKKAQE